MKPTQHALILCFESYSVYDLFHPIRSHFLSNCQTYNILEASLFLDPSSLDTFSRQSHLWTGSPAGKIISNISALVFLSTDKVLSTQEWIREGLGYLWNRILKQRGQLHVIAGVTTGFASFVLPASIEEIEKHLMRSTMPISRIYLQASAQTIGEALLISSIENEAMEKIHLYLANLSKPLTFECLMELSMMKFKAPTYAILCSAELSLRNSPASAYLNSYGRFSPDRFAIIEQLDATRLKIDFIHPLFNRWISQRLTKNSCTLADSEISLLDPSPHTPSQASQKSVAAKALNRTTSCWLDDSISLCGWTSNQQSKLSFSQPVTLQEACLDSSFSPLTNQEVIKSRNKLALKKLILLSLRHVGINKNHLEFTSIWKQLYCGCLFALRKELAAIEIDQSTLLTVIRNNINFLNIHK